MFKYTWLLLFSIALFSGCGKKKKKEPEKTYFSAVSLIKSQVNHVDTSLYPIMRIEYKDSLHSDTVFIPREEFRAAAKDFLELPDIADKSMMSRFNEETFFDKTINTVMITYTPINPAAEEIQREELLATSNGDSGDANVSSIIINRINSNRDSLVEKKMLWQMDKSFQVTTVKRLPGQPETITVVKISWNEVEELYR